MNSENGVDRRRDFAPLALAPRPTDGRRKLAAASRLHSSRAHSSRSRCSVRMVSSPSVRSWSFAKDAERSSVGAAFTPDSRTARLLRVQAIDHHHQRHLRHVDRSTSTCCVAAAVPQHACRCRRSLQRQLSAVTDRARCCRPGCRAAAARPASDSVEDQPPRGPRRTKWCDRRD